MTITISPVPTSTNVLPDLQFWAISGRMCGDDDDTLELIWAKSLAEACSFFKSRIRDQHGIAEDDDDGKKEDQQEIYTICQELIGARVNGVFTLAKACLPPEHDGVAPGVIAPPADDSAPGTQLQRGNLLVSLTADAYYYNDKFFTLEVSDLNDNECLENDAARSSLSINAKPEEVSQYLEAAMKEVESRYREIPNVRNMASKAAAAGIAAV